MQHSWNFYGPGDDESKVIEKSRKGIVLVSVSILVALSIKATACPLKLPPLIISIKDFTHTVELTNTPAAPHCELLNRVKLATNLCILFVKKQMFFPLVSKGIYRFY